MSGRVPLILLACSTDSSKLRFDFVPSLEELNFDGVLIGPAEFLLHWSIIDLSPFFDNVYFEVMFALLPFSL